MKCWLIHPFRHVRVTVFAALLTIAIHGIAWGAETEAPEPPKASWVMSYVFVFVCVGLGLFIVCRGTKRFK